jgi:hypothetical protein
MMSVRKSDVPAGTACANSALRSMSCTCERILNDAAYQMAQDTSGVPLRRRLLREQIGQVIRARTANFINLPSQHDRAYP